METGKQEKWQGETFSGLKYENKQENTVSPKEVVSPYQSMLICHPLYTHA